MPCFLNSKCAKECFAALFVSHYSIVELKKVMHNIDNSLTITKFNRYAVQDVQVRDVPTILKSLRDTECPGTQCSYGP
jgi:hypothetical protein